MSHIIREILKSLHRRSEAVRADSRPRQKRSANSQARLSCDGPIPLACDLVPRTEIRKTFWSSSQAFLRPYASAPENAEASSFVVHLVFCISRASTRVSPPASTRTIEMLPGDGPPVRRGCSRHILLRSRMDNACFDLLELKA